MEQTKPDSMNPELHNMFLKALLHGAINCSYNCNRIAATFESAITNRQSVLRWLLQRKDLYWLCET